MAQKLKLIREEKLYRLLPGKKKKSPLEASGVALVDDNTAAVIFDNLSVVARVDLSLEPKETNRIFPAPTLGEGFEDIALDHHKRHVFCLVEALEDLDGKYRGFISEYDPDFRLLRCSRLSTTFVTENKGFEGLAHFRYRRKEYLFALCEGNLGTAATSGGGRIEVFTRSGQGDWTWVKELDLPDSAEFQDYAAMSFRDGRIAIVSQASARVWVATFDRKARALVPGSEAVYRFPKKGYCNVEGIAWLDDHTLVAVSDRKKKRQPERCADKDQSIHIFRLPDA